MGRSRFGHSPSIYALYMTEVLLGGGVFPPTPIMGCGRKVFLFPPKFSKHSSAFAWSALAPLARQHTLPRPVRPAKPPSCTQPSSSGTLCHQPVPRPKRRTKPRTGVQPLEVAQRTSFQIAGREEGHWGQWTYSRVSGWGIKALAWRSLAPSPRWR